VPRRAQGDAAGGRALLVEHDPRNVARCAADGADERGHAPRSISEAQRFRPARSLSSAARATSRAPDGRRRFERKVRKLPQVAEQSQGSVSLVRVHKGAAAETTFLPGFRGFRDDRGGHTGHAQRSSFLL
jgi:hypothetical protein